MNYVNRKSLAVALLMPLASMLVAPASHGDITVSTGPSTAAVASFGGKAAMDVWAQDLDYYVLGDNRINQIFRFGGDAERQEAFRDDVEALVLSSPVPQAEADALGQKYGLSLTETEYNAVIEDAYVACEASRMRYAVCNRIVAALGPLDRAVTKR